MRWQLLVQFKARSCSTTWHWVSGEDHWVLTAHCCRLLLLAYVHTLWHCTRDCIGAMMALLANRQQKLCAHIHLVHM